MKQQERQAHSRREILTAAMEEFGIDIRIGQHGKHL